MRFRTTEVLFGMLLAVALFAMGMLFSSQYPRPPTQTNSAEKTDGDATKKDPPKPFWQTAATDPVAAFTLGLLIVGVFQAGFFFVQLKLIRESLGPAEQAAKAAAEGAEAAKLNAQAVVDADRARIFVMVDQDTTDSIRLAAQYVNSPEMDSGTISSGIGLFFGFKNYGKTPAIIKEMSAQVILAPELPKEREYIVRVPLPLDHIIAADQRTDPQTLVASLDHQITVGVAKDIQAMRNALWFYGYISYDDTFGWGRELRFIFNYDGGTGGRFRLYSYREIQSTERHEK